MTTCRTCRWLVTWPDEPYGVCDRAGCMTELDDDASKCEWWEERDDATTPCVL
jgi:hypothetical protein